MSVPVNESSAFEIDHEAIRAIGETMAQHIGTLALPETDRDPLLATLNACASKVSYAELFEEDARLTAQIDKATINHKFTDETLRIELLRLDNLATTFAKKMPTKHKDAVAAVERKKEALAYEAEQAKARLDEPRLRLVETRDELTATIDAVSMPWPVAPAPPEVLEAVTHLREGEAAEQRREEAADTPGGEEGEPKEEEWWKDADEEQAQMLAEGDRLEPEVRVPGPYAELAESIPTLSDRLMHHVSEHVHAYDGIETAGDALDRAVEKPEDERTEQENLLLKAVHVLRHRFLEKPNNMRFLEVYEAADIIKLAERLHHFSHKSRPDFEGLEGKILEKAAVRRPLLGRDVPKSLRDATQRMEDDAEARSGMQWKTLGTYANRACDMMRAKFLAGGNKNVHLKNYLIDVADRSGTKPDLSWVYQFIVDDFSFEVLGERRNAQQAVTQEKFMKNCEIIAEWLEEAGSALGQLPKDFRLQRSERRRVRSFQRGPRKAAYDSAPAGPRIHSTIKDIIIRRDGTGDSKVPRHKPMAFDPMGALNHQLRLGHMIDALKDELTTYDVAEGHSEEIIPFA